MEELLRVAVVVGLTALGYVVGHSVATHRERAAHCEAAGGVYVRDGATVDGRTLYCIHPQPVEGR